MEDGMWLLFSLRGKVIEVSVTEASVGMLHKNVASLLCKI